MQSAFSRKKRNKAGPFDKNPTWMYQQNDYEQAVKWITNGLVITEPLVTMHLSFEKYEEAYRFIEEQGETTLKVVIDLDKA